MAEYTLTNDGTKWWAAGELPSGRKVRYECGDGAATREAAEAIAAFKWQQRLWAADASRKRWDGVRARGGAAAAPASSGRSSTPARAAELRQRLIAAGDSKPLPTDDDDGQADDELDDDDGQADDELDDDGDGQADDGQGAAAGERPKVYASPEEAKAAAAAEEEGDPEDDAEAAELLADVIGNGLWSGVTGGVTKVLKHAKPPRSPGEPHELFVKFGREGCCYRMRKLIGKGAKLSPNAKLMIGLAGTIVTMIWSSEVIEEERTPAGAKREAEKPPAAAPGSAPAHANGVAKEAPKLALVKPAPAAAPEEPPPEDPIGRFS